MQVTVLDHSPSSLSLRQLASVLWWLYFIVEAALDSPRLVFLPYQFSILPDSLWFFVRLVCSVLALFQLLHEIVVTVTFVERTQPHRVRFCSFLLLKLVPQSHFLGLMFFLHVVLLKLLNLLQVHGLVDLLDLFFEGLQFLLLWLFLTFGELFFHEFIFGLGGLILLVKPYKLQLWLLPPFFSLLDPFYSFLDALPPFFFLLRTQILSFLQCLLLVF